MINVLYNGARVKLGLTPVRDGSDGAAGTQLQPDSTTRSLLERLTADIAEKERPRMKPSYWGGDNEEEIKVLSTDDYDTCIKEYERKRS